MRRRSGFTLIELILVTIILGAIAAIVVPRFAGAAGTGRGQAISVSVRQVRQLIGYHASAGIPPLAPSGFPQDIEATWFHLNKMPIHTWTGQEMVVEVVTGAMQDIYPAVKTFDPNGADPDAWYNTTNGAFCVRVQPESNDARTMLRFNEANVAAITSLAQTTP